MSAAHEDREKTRADLAPTVGARYVLVVRLYSRSTLLAFFRAPGHEDAEAPLRAWFHEAEKAEWASPADIKARYPHASFVGNDRVVFNIGGNKYRLIVRIDYRGGHVLVRFVGTHAEYDKIDAATV